MEGVRGEVVPEEETSLDLIAFCLLVPRAQLLEVMGSRGVGGGGTHPPPSFAGTPVEGFLNASPCLSSLHTSPCQLAVTKVGLGDTVNFSANQCGQLDTPSPMKSKSKHCRRCPTPSAFLHWVLFLSPHVFFEFSFIPS